MGKKQTRNDFRQILNGQTPNVNHFLKTCTSNVNSKHDHYIKVLKVPIPIHGISDFQIKKVPYVPNTIRYSPTQHWSQILYLCTIVLLYKTCSIKDVSRQKHLPNILQRTVTNSIFFATLSVQYTYMVFLNSGCRNKQRRRVPVNAIGRLLLGAGGRQGVATRDGEVGEGAPSLPALRTFTLLTHVSPR